MKREIKSLTDTETECAHCGRRLVKYCGACDVADLASSETNRSCTCEPFTFSDCACYHDCGDDSHSGSWHQHEDEPCPVHPDAPMVG